MSEPRLHLLMEPAAQGDCRNVLAEGDTLVLADQAVRLLMSNRAWPDGVTLVFLEADRQARGLPPAEGFLTWSDEDLVVEVADHAQVLSW